MLELPHALQPKTSAGAFDDCDASDDRRSGLIDGRQAVTAPFVERIGVDQAQSHIEAWTDLGTRALESNVFLDPAFALPAARHVSRKRRPSFLFVWQGDATTPRKRLIGLWPIAPLRHWGSTVETWVHDYCCSGAPLLDGDDALAALDAVAAFLRESNSAAPMLSAARLRGTVRPWRFCAVSPPRRVCRSRLSRTMTAPRSTGRERAPTLRFSLRQRKTKNCGARLVACRKKDRSPWASRAKAPNSSARSRPS